MSYFGVWTAEGMAWLATAFAAAIVPPDSPDHVLMESGDDVLLESGDLILLE